MSLQVMHQPTHTMYARMPLMPLLCVDYGACTTWSTTWLGFHVGIRGVRLASPTRGYCELPIRLVYLRTHKNRIAHADRGGRSNSIGCFTDQRPPRQYGPTDCISGFHGASRCASY